MPGAVADRLVAAIVARDEAAISACFAEDVSFRALTPHVLRERDGASGTAELIADWFASSTELEPVEVREEPLADRTLVCCRYVGVKEGEPFVLEHRVVCVLEGDRIAKADLLCTGFRPRPAPVPGR